MLWWGKLWHLHPTAWHTCHSATRGIVNECLKPDKNFEPDSWIWRRELRIKIDMPGKTRKPSIEEKLKQNIEFLDALLADLQATSPTVSASPTQSRGRQASNGRESPDNPPPLPPPPSFEALDPHGSNPKDDVLFPPPVPSSSLGQNLSELDSLLENLSNPIHYPSDPTGKSKRSLKFTKFTEPQVWN